jgi:hypothetical protein
MAQQEAQAGDEPIVLTRQGRTRVIKPGRRIKLFGPPGTQAIKGKLVSMGDSISIRPDNVRYKDRVRTVAVADVQAIGMRRLGWQVLGIYYASQIILLLTFGVILSLTAPVFVAGALLASVAQALYSALLIGACFLLAFPRFRLSSWNLVRRGNR